MQLDVSPPRAFPVTRGDVRTIPLRGGRWRVTRARGEVIGYVELVADAAGPRYRGQRMRPHHDGFVSLGDFARPEDALDVVRG